MSHMPQTPDPIEVPLSTGETITIKPFKGRDFINSRVLAKALSSLNEKLRTLKSLAAKAPLFRYQDACIAARLTLQEAAELTEEEAQAKRLPSLEADRVTDAQVIETCHAELAQILQYKLAYKGEDFLDTISIPDLMSLMDATFKVENVNGDDEGKAQESLAWVEPKPSVSKRPPAKTSRTKKKASA